MNECETCWYYDYDEEYDEYYCMQDLDEDEYVRIMTSKNQHCPAYRQGDDYALARKHYPIRTAAYCSGFMYNLRLRLPLFSFCGRHSLDVFCWID